MVNARIGKTYTKHVLLVNRRELFIFRENYRKTCQAGKYIFGEVRRHTVQSFIQKGPQFPGLGVF